MKETDTDLGPIHLEGRPWHGEKVREAGVKCLDLVVQLDG